MEEQAPQESSKVTVVGYGIMLLSLVLAGIGIGFFSKVPSQSYSYVEVWSAVSIFYFVGAGISGIIFGYVITKIGSILAHLEKLSAK